MLSPVEMLQIYESLQVIRIVKIDYNRSARSNVCRCTIQFTVLAQSDIITKTMFSSSYTDALKRCACCIINYVSILIVNTSVTDIIRMMVDGFISKFDITEEPLTDGQVSVVVEIMYKRTKTTTCITILDTKNYLERLNFYDVILAQIT
jgi:hypothetical protein